MGVRDTYDVNEKAGEMLVTVGSVSYRYSTPGTFPDQLSITTVATPSPTVSEGLDRQTISSSSKLFVQMTAK